MHLLAPLLQQRLLGSYLRLLKLIFCCSALCGLDFLIQRPSLAQRRYVRIKKSRPAKCGAAKISASAAKVRAEQDVAEATGRACIKAQAKVSDSNAYAGPRSGRGESPTSSSANARVFEVPVASEMGWAASNVIRLERLRLLMLARCSRRSSYDETTSRCLSNVFARMSVCSLFRSLGP